MKICLYNSKLVFKSGESTSGDLFGSVNLTDAHKTAIYESTDGQNYTLNQEGYIGWAKIEAVVKPVSIYIKGNFSAYNRDGITIPPVVFLGANNAIIGTYFPENYVTELSPIEVDSVEIPEGCTKIAFQCFTGDPVNQHYAPTQKAYIYPY